MTWSMSEGELVSSCEPQHLSEHPRDAQRKFAVTSVKKKGRETQGVARGCCQLASLGNPVGITISSNIPVQLVVIATTATSPTCSAQGSAAMVKTVIL